MDPLSAGISAGGSIFSSIFGSLFNSGLAAQTRKWQTKEREASQDFQNQQREASQAFQTSERQDQNAFSEQQYLKYNSPQAMAQQYRAAGLNPSVMMSGSAGQTVSSGSTGGAPSGSSPGFGSVNPPYMQSESISSAFGNLANAMKSIADAKRSGVDTKILEAKANDLIKQESLRTAGMELLNQYQGKLNEKTATEILKIAQDIETGKLTQNELHERIGILGKESKLKQFELDNIENTYRHQMENLEADTNLKKSSTKLNEAQTEVAYRTITEIASRVAKNYAEARNLNIHSDQVLQFQDATFEKLLNEVVGNQLDNSLKQDAHSLNIHKIKNMIEYGVEQIPGSIIDSVVTRLGHEITRDGYSDQRIAERDNDKKFNENSTQSRLRSKYYNRK